MPTRLERRARTARPGVALLLLGLLAGACAQSAGSTGRPAEPAPTASGPSGTEITMTGDDPVVLTHRLESGPDMAIEGRLGYDADTRCLTFASGDRTYTPIWPDDVQPAKGRRGVTVPGVGVISAGEWLTGGGEFWVTGTAKARQVPAEVRSACQADHGFAVLNAGDITKGRNTAD